jgi:predicted DNA-binding ribbon-helix-helix protein
MTMIQIELPEATAQAARAAGLLTSAALEKLLVEAIRRQAGRKFLEVAKLVQEAGIEEMSMDEINEEVKAVRAERRARETARQSGDAGRS